MTKFPYPHLILSLPLTFLLGAGPAFAAAKIDFQGFNDLLIQKNKAGTSYPAQYYSTTEGGTLLTENDSKKRIADTKGSLKLTLKDGFQFYLQWNPWDTNTRDFTRAYIADPSSWKFNTFNRFSFWFFPSIAGSPEKNNGSHNYYVGTYVKRITNADRYSDETGGGHYYHNFNVLRNQWALCIFNSHPGHKRGNSGGIDTGNVPYPTTTEYGGSGDPSRTYNYFDTLTRFYIQESISGGTFPREYWIDEIQFYQEVNPENDEQLYSICASYTPKSNRIFLTWNRPKDENSIKHEVRYSFSDIHTIGWSNAITAPNGIITPPGWQGYNGMVYDTTAINTGENTKLYLAIKPENSALFSQIALPIIGPLSTPKILPDN